VLLVEKSRLDMVQPGVGAGAMFRAGSLFAKMIKEFYATAARCCQMQRVGRSGAASFISLC
jgi:hypothetical protein